jgi:hypothetical protein
VLVKDEGKGLVIHTVDSPVTVLVSLSNHLIHLVVSQLLANGCHDMAKLSSGDKTVVVTIKDLWRPTIRTLSI